MTNSFKKIFLVFSLTLLSALCFSMPTVDKKKISQQLDELEKSGQFSPEQVKMAKEQLKSMDDEQINGLIQKGIEKAKDPEFQKKVKEMTNK